VAGSRSITDIEVVMWAIIESKFDITEIVSGGAKGVDQLAEQIANEHLIPFTLFPAKWDDLTDCKNPKRNQYGLYDPRAGLKRNKQMAIYADGAVLIHDGLSRGTINMMENMKKLCKPVYMKVHQ
jgi:hypothetical protein